MHRRLEAKHGCEALKLLVKIKELEVVIEIAKAEAEGVRRRVFLLRSWKEIESKKHGGDSGSHNKKNHDLVHL